jgi:DNA-binding ferritin-like protein (Dps family)
MNFWDTMTGGDLTREWKAFEARAEVLPAGYRAAWKQVKAHLFPYAGFTGRNLMPILDGALGLLEEAAADGLGISEVLGDDIAGFCAALAGGQEARSYRDRWREQLNRNVARKLGQLGGC